MQTLSPFTDIQPLAKKGLTTEKLSPDINASIIMPRVQKHLENTYSLDDYKIVPKHMVFLIEENILTGITN